MCFKFDVVFLCEWIRRDCFMKDGVELLLCGLLICDLINRMM